LRVVLVEPIYEGNVGSVARSMKNFGFRDLVLVNPCKIEDFGLAMAAHARDVLQMSRCFSTLQEALQAQTSWWARQAKGWIMRSITFGSTCVPPA